MSNTSQEHKPNTSSTASKPKSIARTAEMEAFLDRVAGIGADGGDTRTKTVVRRIVSDLYRTIEDLDIQPNEFWAAVAYLGAAGQAREVALLSPGLGFDHYLDLRLDEADRLAGVKANGTPRTIEGPLYVAGAPVAKGEARLDDGKDAGETLITEGRVLDLQGKPIPGAFVEVWHADTKGNYSFFDPTQSEFNLRRTIETDENGRYRFQTIVPSGYGCPPDGTTQKLLTRLGRHGRRPAHIHFFVHAEGHRHLTTQINLAGDPLVNDDFAFATRDELIAPVTRKDGHAEITFDFVLEDALGKDSEGLSPRERVSLEK